MRTVTGKRVGLRSAVLAAAGVGLFSCAAYGDFIISVAVGPTVGKDTDYVLSAVNNTLHNTGNGFDSFDLTVTTPGSGAAGALVIDLQDDINDDGVIDANVGGEPSFNNGTPEFGNIAGTFLGFGSSPLTIPLGTSEPSTITTPTAVDVSGKSAVYLSSGGVSTGLNSAFLKGTVHSLEVAGSVSTGIGASQAIPFANIVVPTGTKFSFSGTINGTSVVGTGPGSPPPAVSSLPVLSLTGTPPTNSNLIANLDVAGLHGAYVQQTAAVTGAAESEGYVSVSGFNPTGDKEIYGLALDVDDTFLPQGSPVLASIIGDLNTVLGTSGTASLISPSMASAFPTSAFDVMITFPKGPTPSTASPADFAFDFTNYTSNGTVTVTNLSIVPEPVGGALMLGALALLARRRRQIA